MTDNYYENYRRFAASTNGGYCGHFSPQYMEPSQSIWSQYPLKPSTSIWGFSVQPSSHHDIKSQEQWDYHGQHTPYSAIPLANHHSSISAYPHISPRQSIASLSSSTSSSSSPIWGEDSLFSPPLSPQQHSKSELNQPVNNSHFSSISPSSAHIPKSNIDCNYAIRGSEIERLGSPSENMRPPSPATSSPLSSERLVISCSCGPLYVVQFKGSRRDIFTAPGTMSYSIGDAVMVDADRGKDLGVITQVNISRHEAAALKQQQHNDRQQVLHNTNNASTSTSESGPTIYTPKQILSTASISEIKDLASKVEDEKSAISLCNKKVGERGLDMEIVDAEYQWDRRKLTFFYTANSRVDFRDLVRELFRIYKTRIWMCATTARN